MKWSIADYFKKQNKEREEETGGEREPVLMMTGTGRDRPSSRWKKSTAFNHNG